MAWKLGGADCLLRSVSNHEVANGEASPPLRARDARQSDSTGTGSGNRREAAPFGSGERRRLKNLQRPITEQKVVMPLLWEPPGFSMGSSQYETTSNNLGIRPAWVSVSIALGSTSCNCRYHASGVWRIGRIHSSRTPIGGSNCVAKPRSGYVRTLRAKHLAGHGE